MLMRTRDKVVDGVIVSVKEPFSPEEEAELLADQNAYAQSKILTPEEKTEIANKEASSLALNSAIDEFTAILISGEKPTPDVVKSRIIGRIADQL